MVYSVTIVTLFPEAFPGLLGESIVGRARREGVWALDVVNIRDFGLGKHKNVDDTPYGGGAGMLMRPDVVSAAIHKAVEGKPTRPRVVFLAPHGARFTQAKAREWAGLEEGLVLLCGHYEGIDQRVLDAEVDEVVSLGDFVLSGGEPAAVCMIDTIVRLLPGALGADASLHEESFDIRDPETGDALLEYPHYTRPAVWEGREVPAVLQSGNHAEIEKWRLAAARARTKG